MDASQNQRVREVFERLIALPASFHRAELDRLFTAEDPVRREVESLLASRLDVTVSQPPVPPGRPRPGLALAGRYRLVRLLGAGGFSQAYLAEDEHLHKKRIVVKIPLPESNLADEWFARHFVDEVRALAALNHPGIVQVFDSANDPVLGNFFTEQYIEGPTLAYLLKDGPLGLERSARLLEGVARALGAAHAKGIVHRDLKPHNILVRMPNSLEETPVIIDFGIASLLDTGAAVPRFTRVAGTPDYQAPEQARGRVLPESDLYALGCIAVELLTGERLHARMARQPAGELPEHVAAQMLAERVPQVPEAVRDALTQLLSMNPFSRGKAAQHAAGLFRDLAPTVPPPIPPAPPVPEPHPPEAPTPSRRGWVAGACAAAGGVGLLAWTYSREGPPPVAIQLQAKLRRAGQKGNEFISPVDGVVTRDHRLRLELTLSPAAFCYVFAESLAGGAATGGLLALFPPTPDAPPQAIFTVPSTATDWIEFDNRPELLRLIFVASLAPLPEAVNAVRSARLQAGGVLQDREVRQALEARLRQLATVTWRPGQPGIWTAGSSLPAMCVEGRLRHVGT